MYSGLKILETITEAFFSIWVYFHKPSRFTGQQGKGEAISLIPHGGQTFLDKEFMKGLFWMEGLMIRSCQDGG